MPLNGESVFFASAAGRPRILVFIGPNAGGKTRLARRLPQARLHEHPETRLYPLAQIQWVRLFVRGGDFHNPARTDRHIIETHSPYILSALNSLLYAGKIAKEFPERREKVNAVVPLDLVIDPAHLSGFYIANGALHSIMDAETGLLHATEIDDASDIMGEEFRRLLDIEYDNEDAA